MMNTNQPGIYAIRSLVCGRRYVGSAVNIRKRWWEHRHHLRQGDHHAPSLQKAWAQHGEHNFIFEVIEAVAVLTDLIGREQFWIDGLNAAYRQAGFNAAPLAASSLGIKRSDETRERLKGRVVTAETRAKMRASALGRKQSPETIQKRVVKATGRKRTPEHNAIMVAILTGKKRSDATKAVWSAQRKGRKLSDEHKAKLAATSAGREKSAETRAKLRAANIGKKLTPEHCAKMAEAMRKRGLTPGMLEKAIAANTGKALSAERRARIGAALKISPKAIKSRAETAAARIRRRDLRRVAAFVAEETSA